MALIHSTGALFASHQLPALTFARIAQGAPAATTQPIGNFNDASPLTIGDLPVNANSTRYYLQIDTGAAGTLIGSVILSNLTLTNATVGVLVYVSNTAIAGGNFAGATALPVVGALAAAAANVRARFDAVGGGAAGRYIYIVPTISAPNNYAVTIGDVDVRAPLVEFATIQNVSVQPEYQMAILRGAAFLDNYPVADACFDFNLTLQAESADFSPFAFEILTGAAPTLTAGYYVTQPNTTDNPPKFVLAFETQTTKGKKVRWTIYEAVAPGLSWEAQRAGFAIQKFTARAYLSDPTAVAYKIEVEQ